LHSTKRDETSTAKLTFDRIRIGNTLDPARSSSSIPDAYVTRQTDVHRQLLAAARAYSAAPIAGTLCMKTAELSHRTGCVLATEGEVLGVGWP
jgi:hypothetical protein